MSYHVGRNNQPLGQFTEAEIREGLERGTFFTNDLTWREGMPEWKPLDQVFGFAAAYTLSTPLTAIGPTAMGSIPPPVTAQPPGHFGLGVMPAPGTAIASLVLGVLAILSFFMCFVGGLLAVPGIICGHSALTRIRRSGDLMQGRGMAIAGLVISYLTLAIGLAVILIFGLVFGAAAASAGAGG